MEIIQQETAAFRDQELSYTDIHNEEAEEEKKMPSPSLS
jgi:hypothetical protein